MPACVCVVCGLFARDSFDKKYRCLRAAHFFICVCVCVGWGGGAERRRNAGCEGLRRADLIENQRQHEAERKRLLRAESEKLRQREAERKRLRT